mmetsp:Transcript_58/g.117  ORF Transcript_58/g.117 Transcript_58/m.117 type:complete len:1144 (-) Transcript_58:199-3630(-)
MAPVTPLMVESKPSTMKPKSLKAPAPTAPPTTRAASAAAATRSKAKPSSSVVEQENPLPPFATPDRPVDKKNKLSSSSESRHQAHTTPDSEGTVKTVTPLDGQTKTSASNSNTNASLNKTVRFNNNNNNNSIKTENSKDAAENDEEAENVVAPLAPTEANVSPASSNSTSSSRGVVSRRGRGRGPSPGRPVAPSTSAPPPSTTKGRGGGSADASVLEYKTFRSPARIQVRTDSGDLADSGTVPSLCSASSSLPPNRAGAAHPVSGGETNPLASTATVPNVKREEETAVSGKSSNGPSRASAVVVNISTVPASDESGKASSQSQLGKPQSITCDPSMIDSTSPLASDNVDTSPERNNKKSANPPALPNPKIKRESPPLSPKPRKQAITAAANSATLSPPPPSDIDKHLAAPRKTPTRSPGQFQSLPSLNDAKLNSPSLFLSPYSPNPLGLSFDQGGQTPKADNDKDDEDKSDDNHPDKDGVEEEKSSKTRDELRERSVATPTDFAVDFGKGHQSSSSFDASNVLAWLQSPTAHGLFSPGGMGSNLNTPRGYYTAGPGAPRTPRTPTVSTSFFFSDVASLPKNGEFQSPKPQGDGGPGPNKRDRTGGNMICISPLASRKDKGQKSEPNTPMNYKDIFASPRLPHPRGADATGNHGKPRGMPSLSESPGGKGRSGLEAVHMAERDLMEDEDLSVLLQLASHSNTPKGPGGAAVFRSPHGKNPKYQGGYSKGNAPHLQLPMIGDQRQGHTAKLSRKTGFREPGEDFVPPPLGIRSSSSGGSKEMYTGKDENKKGKSGSGSTSKGKSGDAGKRKVSSSAGPPSKKTKAAPPPHPQGYPMTHGGHGHPPHYQPRPGDPPYYPIPQSMAPMPSGGSMKVVVGAPPPNGRTSPTRGPVSNSPHRPPPYTMSQYPPHKDSGYPPPYPPPKYPYHPPPPHHMSSGSYPPYGHYPPPPPHHMPMYSSQHPPPSGAKNTSSKKSKPSSKMSKSSTKKTDSKNGGMSSGGSPKKQKKSPSKAGGARRKPKSTNVALNDPAERQKAAAAIQAVNQASGGKNDKAAALAAAILRGVTMRPSGKWQAQLYYAGKSRYIGVFDTREKAALAYEIAREKLKAENKSPSDQSAQSLKATENAVNAARKAAFDGVNEKDPRGK